MRQCVDHAPVIVQERDVIILYVLLDVAAGFIPSSTTQVVLTSQKRQLTPGPVQRLIGHVYLIV